MYLPLFSLTLQAATTGLLPSFGKRTVGKLSLCEECCSPAWWVLPWGSPSHSKQHCVFIGVVSSTLGFTFTLKTALQVTVVVSSTLGFTFTLKTTMRVHPCGEFHPRVHLDTQNSTARAPLWWGVPVAPSNSCCLPWERDGSHANNYSFQGVHVAYLLLPKTRAP